MSKVSVVIITFNEENIIEQCILAAQKVSDEIIIVDSFSTDRTKEICIKLGAKFITQKWLGYSAQKNFGALQAKYNWILSLDADEILSEEFVANFNKIESLEANTIYRICRLNNYCGKWIKHGRWYPEWRNRIYDRNLAQWNSDLVHEDLEVINNKKNPSTTFVKINGDVFHYSMKSKEEHLEKIEKYASLSAQKLKQKDKKASFVKRYLSPASKFIIDYFFRAGFLDGKLGFQIAKLNAYETFLKYKKLHKLNTIVK